MKVAFVSQPWDTLNAPVSSGSIPIWTYEAAKRLVARGDCEVTIYARQSEGQLAYEMAGSIAYRRVSTVGNRVCNAGCKGLTKVSAGFRYLNSRLYCLPYFWRVARELRRRQYDVVHIHNFSQAVPIVRSLNPNIKIVLHMHCEWLTQFDQNVIARRLALCDLVIGCSDYVIEKIRDRFPLFSSITQRVFNGVDIQQFTPAKTARTTEAQTVLFVGRISPEKGLHTLLSAFEQVAERFPNAQLNIVGPNKPASAEFIAELSEDPIVQKLALLDPPNYLQRLKEQVPDAIASRISWVGPISHLQLQDSYHQADVLVNPSFSEAFGMSLVEAMASGLPVVATRVGGMVDVVREGETGLLVPMDDAVALAGAIGRLLADAPLRVEMGAKGRSRAEKLFSWEAIATDLLTHYQTLLEPSHTEAST